VWVPGVQQWVPIAFWKAKLILASGDARMCSCAFVGISFVVDVDKPNYGRGERVRKLSCGLAVRVMSILVCLIVVAVSPVVTESQSAAARIVGNITDPNGSSVPNAKVTVVSVSTQVHYDTTANKDGYFQTVDLPIGKYRVTLEADGFRTVTYEDQNLLINQVLRINAKLELGSVAESIEVHEQADVVETVNPTLGASVSGRTLTDMPLNGRNALDLALLQPGVTPSNPDDTSAGTFNIAGGRSDSVTFLLDGGLNNENLGNGVVFNPNPDTIAEFRILKSDYTAEYGRNGGGIITEVIKSGTNDWHGSAFDFVRNDAFNANTFFNNKAGLPREVLKRNQFGGTFGGPITVPHLVHGKDKFFFFVGYQGQRQTQKESQTGISVFTPAQLGGDFSNGGVAGNCPNADAGVAAFLQANPFFQSVQSKAACGIIDPAKINTVSQKYIAAGLIPSATGGVLNSQSSATNNDNELTLKFDFNITQKDRLAVTLGGDRRPRLSGFGFGAANVPGFPETDSTHNYFSNFAYTHTFSPNLLSEFRVTVQRQNVLQDSPARQLPLPSALGFTNVTGDNPVGPPGIEFLDNGTNAQLSVQGPSTLINNTFGYTDTVSWTHGRHNFKFGGGFTAYQFNTNFDFFVGGLFFFQGSSGLFTGNDFADFLVGTPVNFSQSPAAPTNARSKFYNGFAQDEWRVNKRLVLTLGVRYEYATPKLDTKGKTFDVIPGHAQSVVFPNAPSGLVFPGDPNAPRGVNFPDKSNWAPRLGFAWDPTGSSKTSIRGGFGIFYDILKAEDNFQDNGQPPFFAAASNNFFALGTPGTDPTSGQTNPSPFFADPFTSVGTVNPFPSKPVDHNVNFKNANFLPFGNSFIFLDDPHLRTPRIYQYSLSVQRELARNTSVEIAYAGSISRGLTSLVDINPFIPGTQDRILNLLPGNTTCAVESGATAGNCSFSNLEEFKNVGRANYNSLQAGITRQLTDARFVGRTYFTLGYTYAHSIDNASGFRNRNSEVPTFQPNLLRASSDFDVRNRFTFSGGWDLPFDRAWSSGPKRLTQGWSLFPIFSWRQGFPLDILASLQANGGFTDPTVSGAGDGSGINAAGLVRVNLTGQPITIFDPHGVQTLPGAIGGSSGNHTGNFYFNPAAFSNAQVGSGIPGCTTPSATCFPTSAQVEANAALATYGTLPRNFFRGPGYTNLDLTISKTTAITEHLKLEIRGDFFNALNHTYFSNPITNPASPRFGRIVSNPLDSQRIIQLAARLSF